MHPSDRQWWLTHSSEYVLGLLSDPDRLVFERIIQVDPEVLEMVVDWREKLQPMSDALQPIEPPEHILSSLIANLPEQPEPSASASSTSANGAISGNEALAYKQADKRAAVLADGTSFKRMVDGKQKAVDGWRSFAGWATVACVLGGILGFVGLQKFQALNTAHQYDAMSIVEDASATPLWIVDSSADAKVLRATAIAPPELEAGKAYELWINKPDSSVVSMGLLPTEANRSKQFNAHKFDPEATSFSVSLEPESGSPQSLPTGPIMFRGLIQQLQF